MSWHHGDYINLIASVGGVGSAIFAAFATYQARVSIQSNVRENERSRLLDELVRLSERCNSCVGDDKFVTETIENLAELLTACHYAMLAIDQANLNEQEKHISKWFFIRQLRPSINGEIGGAHALFSVKGALQAGDLKEMYREAQVFLETEERKVIP